MRVLSVEGVGEGVNVDVGRSQELNVPSVKVETGGRGV